MKVLKDKMLNESRESSEAASNMRNEELINPWLITDIDYKLDDNYFSNSGKV